MMLSNSFIILFITLTSYVCAILDAPTILNNGKGVLCSPIQSKPNKPSKSYIKLKTQHLKYEDNLQSIQALIFHYPDIVNFTAIPTLEEFAQLYPNEKKVLYKTMLTDDHKFNVNAESGYNVDKTKFWEGELSSKNDVVFKISQSGIYCVYIAPILENDQKEKLGAVDFKVPIVFKNYYGNLSYPMYLIYSTIKYVVVISIIMFIVLFNYILRFKIGENFQNLNSISVISKGILFLILAPFICLDIFQGFVFWCINNFLETDSKSFIMSTLFFINETIDSIYSSFRNYVVLLFAMGFGVIYYYNGNSNNYRLFPQESFRKITAFLFINIIALIVNNILNYLFLSQDYQIVGLFSTMGSPASTTSGFDTNDNNNNFLMLSNTIVSLFQLCWFVLSVIFYFKTKKTIATFPSASDPDSNQKVVSAFRKSFFVIMVLPIITAIIGGLISGILTLRSFSNVPDFPQNSNRDLVYQSALMIIMLENSLGKFIMPIVYSTLFYYFTLILSIFFIWIKDNNGLIYSEDDPVAYADVSNFNISDDDDNGPTEEETQVDNAQEEHQEEEPVRI
ncbi:hypothetical protein KGF54_003256 [Candida jiufengensis]|uniref:uncharacterized protein n=1 Tax=Candida jiufengensis TaxID=497108 RepID=UPI00222523C7|nr:uncharacterized protein KGF54_003256 [Candida jiufengensis]KAI5952389.1 hypothetical protein KGF54_003256 [Candida jiufengensis]